MPDRSKSVERLKRQIAAIEQLRNKYEQWDEFKKWHRDTEVVIEKIFGSTGRHLRDFDEINYSPMVVTNSTTDEDYRRRYLSGLDEAKAVLESFIGEIEEFWDEEVVLSSTPATSITIVEKLCTRFHLVARELRTRRQGRPTLEVEDEYDVQDLLRSLLSLHFDDVRPEEWTPSYAGGSSRVDFLLKQEQIIVEAKKTRRGLEARKLGEELIIDIQRYRVHPDCRSLVCFVYDPEGRITNPRGIENDLNGTRDGIEVKVIIAPSGV
jgi:hypothetical protein